MAYSIYSKAGTDEAISSALESLSSTYESQDSAAGRIAAEVVRADAAYVQPADRTGATPVLISGGRPGTSATLTATISAATAYIGGQRVKTPATPHTFTASRDTYIDLSAAGTYTYVEVANGAAIPALTAGCVRTAKVVTSATAITSSLSYSTNVALGCNALGVGGATWGAVAIGEEALAFNNPDGAVDSGLYNTAVGYRAMRSNTTGHHNTGVGWCALAANTTGLGNTGIGEDALLLNTTGSDNNAHGRHALFSNTTGSRNTGIGSMALGYNTTGINNVAVGMSAGVATFAGVGSCTTDDSMTFLGTYASVDKAVNPGPFSNSTALGARAKVDESNLIQLGSSAVTKVRTAGDFETSTVGKGFVLKSPDGTRYRIAVANGGALSAVAA